MSGEHGAESAARLTARGATRQYLVAIVVVILSVFLLVCRRTQQRNSSKSTSDARKKRVSVAGIDTWACCSNAAGLLGGLPPGWTLRANPCSDQTAWYESAVVLWTCPLSVCVGHTALLGDVSGRAGNGLGGTLLVCGCDWGSWGSGWGQPVVRESLPLCLFGAPVERDQRPRLGRLLCPCQRVHQGARGPGQPSGLIQ